MVPTVTGYAGGPPQPHTRHSMGQSGGRQVSGEPGPSDGRMAYLRDKCRGQKLSEVATSLILKSWRSKTNRSYDSLFGKWHSWCLNRSVDPFSGSVQFCINRVIHTTL